MKLKIGEKVKVKIGFKCKGKKVYPSMRSLEGKEVTIDEIVPFDGGNSIKIKENNWYWNEDDFETISYTGVELLQRIEKREIKNCSIEVYKNNKYQFTIECGEKAILDNPNHHIGMLTSEKYTYKVITKREMTIKEIEEELGYSIKIVKNSIRDRYEFIP